MNSLNENYELSFDTQSYNPFNFSLDFDIENKLKKNSIVWNNLQKEIISD